MTTILSHFNSAGKTTAQKVVAFGVSHPVVRKMAPSVFQACSGVLQGHLKCQGSPVFVLRMGTVNIRPVIFGKETGVRDHRFLENGERQGENACLLPLSLHFAVWKAKIGMTI